MRTLVFVVLMLASCELVPTGTEYFYDVDETQVQTRDFKISALVELRTAEAVDKVCKMRACIIPFLDGSSLFVYQKGDQCALAHELKHKKYGPKHSSAIIKCNPPGWTKIHKL